VYAVLPLQVSLLIKRPISKDPQNNLRKPIFVIEKLFEYATWTKTTKPKSHDKGEYVTSYHIHAPNTPIPA